MPTRKQLCKARQDSSEISEDKTAFSALRKQKQLRPVSRSLAIYGCRGHNPADSWKKNDDNSFSPESNPDLVLAFGTQTMDCGGEINGSPQGVMLAHKNSPNRLIASYVGQRAPNSQSFECRTGQLVAPLSDTVLACQQCVPMTSHWHAGDHVGPLCCVFCAP